MIGPRAKRNISRIIPFGVIWLVVGWVFMLSEHAVLGDQSKSLESAIKISPVIFAFASLSVFLVGIFVGVVEVFFVAHLFRKLNLGLKILGKFILYLVLMSVLMLVLYMLAASIELKTSVFDSAVWDRYVLFFFSITHLSTAVQLAFQLLLSLLYAEISDNLGQHVLYNFFTGKYHTPKEERRIFMFVDMKASTTIAEDLGHIQYFELLRAYYADFSDAIVLHSGEVYQYVGDEIVITWEFPKGIEKNNCVRCFFAMKEQLHKKSEGYISKFGVAPEFKAAIHCGSVTTGEIGALKKEIIFTGDVLNTTARIQSLCNEKGVDLLVSLDLMEQLSFTSDYEITFMGDHALTGKTRHMELFTLAPSV
ncbi:adenylate/guanylate cyclase domain-containing protein [Pareuzebyella sediminis]|uniref:adenylate/guanylate cyclase domain-containing protein n=1 Tax=Pareuzebyella sediminis TaxID=2607998 RepID=UPI001E3FE563|nr:adenylate/guanylate cyclase domain-containing protein [Pareuzebyella sediminis]